MAIPFAETILAGPRLIRRQPLAAGAWIVFQLGAGALSALLLVYLAGPILAQMTETRSGQPDPVRALGLLGKVLPAYLMTFGIALVAWSISTTAVLRAVLRPQDGGFFFMKLGMDEVRQFALMLIWGLIGFAVYLGSAVAGGIVFAIAGAAGPVDSASATPLLIAAVLVVMGGFLLFAAPRFCLASAQTYDMRRVMPFASASLARGRYWSLLAVWLVTMVVAAAVFAGTVGLGGVANLALGPRHVFTLQSGDTTSLATYLTPAVMARLVISALGQGVLWPLMLAPFAAAYRAVAPAHASAVVGERVAEVFI